MPFAFFKINNSLALYTVQCLLFSDSWYCVNIRCLARLQSKPAFRCQVLIQVQRLEPLSPLSRNTMTTSLIQANLWRLETLIICPIWLPQITTLPLKDAPEHWQTIYLDFRLGNNALCMEKCQCTVQTKETNVHFLFKVTSLNQFTVSCSWLCSTQKTNSRKLETVVRPETRGCGWSWSRWVRV